MVHLAPLDVADIVVSDTELTPQYQRLLKSKDTRGLLA
jgi:hypothetical protein